MECRRVYHASIWRVMIVQSFERSNHWDGRATQRKLLTYYHCHSYRCILNLVDPYYSMTFHKSGPGKGTMPMSYACALSSIVSGYEVSRTSARAALKSNNNSKSLVNLSKMIFRDNYCCIYPNLLLSNRQCTKHSRYSFWDNKGPFSS